MRGLISLVVIVLAACGTEPADFQKLSKSPVSVRGWIADVEGADRGEIQTPETEGARLTELFRATNVWVEDAPYVSGGVSEGGSFILLDVPPGDVTITFTAPGAHDARLVLQNIPGNADVLIPGIMLEDGGVSLLRPETVTIRIPADIRKVQPTSQNAIVAGHTIRIVEAPLSAFNDRRDYPERGLRPVAVVK